MEHSYSDRSYSDRVVFDLDVDGSRYILIKAEPAEPGAPSLSPREREIVRMALNISSWTVSTHLRRIFTKLGVSSRAAMVAKVSGFNHAERVQF
jgi:DNA-binding CsgD family transcriptional regulator